MDNRGGAAGTIGLGALAQAKPDGYTLAISASGAVAMLPHIAPKMPFDAARNFQPISLIMTVPQVLAVRKTLGATRVADLVSIAQKQPGKITFGTFGHGTSLHLAAELFRCGPAASISCMCRTAALRPHDRSDRRADQIIDCLVIDLADAEAPRDSALQHCVTATLMRTLHDRERLAREVLAFADRVAG